jgi:hypothetical protein
MVKRQATVLTGVVITVEDELDRIKPGPSRSNRATVRLGEADA